MKVFVIAIMVPSLKCVFLRSAQLATKIVHLRQVSSRWMYKSMYVSSPTMSDNRLDKTTLGLPLFLEDTTGFWQGPTDFFDIYDRPPFIHVRNRVDLVSRRMRIDIFELETTVSASTTSNNDSSSSTRVPVTPRSSHSRYGSRSGISLHLEPDVHGNIVCMNSDTRRRVAAESWLCKCESGGRSV